MKVSMKRKIRNYQTKRDIPLTSIEQYKATRAKINKVNRDRAKFMERRVAKFLCGNRVPGSGAFTGYKGDGKIRMKNDHFFLIECKLSANNHKLYGKGIPFLAKWLEKHINDTNAMKCVFGIFVLHHHETAVDYVLWRIEDVQNYLLEHSTVLTEDLSLTIDNIPPDSIIDYEFKPNGTLRRTYDIWHERLEKTFVKSKFGLRVMIIHTYIGNYLVLPLVDFKSVIKESLLCKEEMH
jgi:hypothetical protein